MKILYISQYFPPEMGAPAARVSELARHWAQQGHSVQVLTGFPNHPTGKVPSEYRSAMRRLVAKEKFSGAHVTRTWLAPFPNRKSWERILNYCSFAISASITGMFLRKPDAVIATSPQLLVGLAGWWLSRLKGAQFIFEVRDLWPESLAAVGAGSKASLLYRVLHRVSAFLYRHADHVVVVTPAFKAHIIEHWGVPAEKISVVQNGVESGMFGSHLDREDTRKELGLENKFVVSYIGTLGNAARLETLIEAAQRVRESLPDALFLMVGAGAEMEKLTRLVERANLDNVRLLGEQSREKVPALIAASDVCVVLLRKSAVFETVIPTKMLEFMASGRAVILGVRGQAREILKAAQGGIAIEPEDSAALSQAVIELAQNPERKEMLGRRGRSYIIENFSRKRTAEQYLQVCNELLMPEAGAKCAAAAD